MNFSEMPYQRPDLPAAIREINRLTQKVKQAENAQELAAAFQELGVLFCEINTARTLATIRHTMNTLDNFYRAENDYFDEQSPILNEHRLAFYRALLASEYAPALDAMHGNLLRQKLMMAIQTSDERLIQLQQEENSLESSYEILYASAKIPFEGKELTVAQLGPYKQSCHRAQRHAAMAAEGLFFDSHREELDEIYDKMVQNRTKQAQILGFAHFTPLGDMRMERIGYTRKDIAFCRSEVLRDIVPVACKLFSRQAERIGLDVLEYYDLPLEFKDGNASPKGTPEEILASGKQMYHELSSETSAFIDFMMERELFDVLAKPGKAPGGYCTYLPKYKSPFIFSNFNATAGDVDVLTHEAGHAFASYLSSKQVLPDELRSPGLESCEIHSMSMEFLTERWHELFFKQDTAKYELSHTQEALSFLPYGCQVDAFQQEVYERTHLTPAQRCDLWLELDKQYRPWVCYGDLPFYARGGGWQRQLHIYTAPFYYIDYVLAQVAALQFFLSARRGFDKTWAQYLALAQKAGTKTYVELVEEAGLKTPFSKGVLKSLSEDVLSLLEQLPLY